MIDVKLWLLYSHNWNHLTGKKSSGSFYNVIYKMYLQILYTYISNIYALTGFGIKSSTMVNMP